MQIRLRWAAVTGALVAAAALAPQADAASVGHESYSSETTSACATWWNPNPPPGTSEVVHVCGSASSSTHESTHVNVESPPVRTSTYDQGKQYHLHAARELCSTTNPTCQTTSHWGWDLSASEVDIDLEAGTARLVAEIQGCAVDIAIDATDGEYAYGNAVPQWHGFNYHPLTFLWTGFSQAEGRWTNGTATGTACDWADIVVGPGDGSIGHHRGEGRYLHAYGGV